MSEFVRLSQVIERLKQVKEDDADSSGVFRNLEYDGVNRLEQEEADYIPFFLGRRCGTCRNFISDNRPCQINRTGPQITDFPVGHSGYCDVYDPVKESLLWFKQLSQEYKPSKDQGLILRRIQEAGPQDRETVGFYQYLVGVCCDTCTHIGVSGTACAAVKPPMSRLGCCNLWKGKKDFPVKPERGNGD